jgi:hypothetical protein
MNELRESDRRGRTIDLLGRGEQNAVQFDGVAHIPLLSGVAERGLPLSYVKYRQSV